MKNSGKYENNLNIVGKTLKEIRTKKVFPLKNYQMAYYYLE